MNTRYESILLWDGDTMPKSKQPKKRIGMSRDGADFKPNMLVIPANEKQRKRKAVIISSGGAFQFRNNEYEGIPAAEELSALGYQTFVVNYRVKPNTIKEGALDLCRAIRLVMANASAYDIDPDHIALMGFSAGGILSGEVLLNFKDTMNESWIDSAYRSDEIDQIAIHPCAIAHIYSYYGSLHHAIQDLEELRRAQLPPTFYVYGTRDPLLSNIQACIQALKNISNPIEIHEQKGFGHGFGTRGDWIIQFDQWFQKLCE